MLVRLPGGSRCRSRSRGFAPRAPHIIATALTMFACSPTPTATVVEVPPTELPQPVPTTTIALPQPPPRRLAACEVPKELSRCTPMAPLRVGHVSLSSPTCFVDARVRVLAEALHFVDRFGKHVLKGGASGARGRRGGCRKRRDRRNGEICGKNGCHITSGDRSTSRSCP